MSGGGEENIVHWAYGSFLGTGWYRVSADRKAFVLRIPPRWTYRQSGMDDEGNRQIGIEFRFPLTLGLAQIDDLGGIINQENFTTASFTPGIELEIPVTEKWLLRPYLRVGWGKELDGGESAWIYEGGIKSRYVLPIKKGDWGLLGAVQYAGYKPNVGASSDMLNLMVGIETRQPLGQFSFRDNPLYLEWQVTYNRLSDPASFRRRGDPNIEIHDFWEGALAVSMGDKPFRIFGMNFDRFGLAYQISSDNRYRAIKINLRSPFTN